MLLYAEAGTEYLLPYAKKKLAYFKQLLGAAGVNSFHRRIDVDNGSVIYIDSTALGNGQFTDKIRITGSGGYKYIVLLDVSPAPIDRGDAMTPLGTPTAYFGEIGSRLPLYGSIQFSYSYTDENDAEQTKIFGTATAGGLGWAWNAGSPATTQAITTATLVGTHLGLPLYAPPATGPGGIVPVYGPHTEYLTAKTTALIRQLTGAAVPTTAVHDQISDAYPPRADGSGTIPTGTEVSFYYVSTESSSRVWGAFGAGSPADGDEKQYLIPLTQVTYDAAARIFTPKNPSKAAVLRDPVKDGRLAAWDWENLSDSAHLQRPVGGAEWGNVVAIFYPRGGDSGQREVFNEQAAEIQASLSEYPTAIAATMLDFVAAATPQPAKYPVPSPP